MSQKRLSMRKIREILRLKYELGRSHREIAASNHTFVDVNWLEPRSTRPAATSRTCTRRTRNWPPGRSWRR